MPETNGTPAAAPVGVKTGPGEGGPIIDPTQTHTKLQWLAVHLGLPVTADPEKVAVAAIELLTKHEDTIVRQGDELEAVARVTGELKAEVAAAKTNADKMIAGVGRLNVILSKVRERPGIASVIDLLADINPQVDGKNPRIATDSYDVSIHSSHAARLPALMLNLRDLQAECARDAAAA
jgi:hypothetical protein